MHHMLRLKRPHVDALIYGLEVAESAIGGDYLAVIDVTREMGLVKDCPPPGSAAFRHIALTAKELSERITGSTFGYPTEDPSSPEILRVLRDMRVILHSRRDGLVAPTLISSVRGMKVW